LNPSQKVEPDPEPPRSSPWNRSSNSNKAEEERSVSVTMNDESSSYSADNASNASLSLDEYISLHMTPPSLKKSGKSETTSLPLPRTLKPVPQSSDEESITSVTMSVPDNSNKFNGSSCLVDKNTYSVSSLSDSARTRNSGVRFDDLATDNLFLGRSNTGYNRNVNALDSSDIKTANDSFASLDLDMEESGTVPDDSQSDNTMMLTLSPLKKQHQLQQPVDSSLSTPTTHRSNLSSDRSGDSVWSSPGKRPLPSPLAMNDSTLHRISCARPPPAENGSIELPSDAEDDEEDATSFSGAPVPENKIEDDGDSPEAMVLRETRALRVFRVVVYLILMSSTAFSVAFTFRSILKGEQESFQADFDEVASRLVDSFIHESRLKLQVVNMTAAIATHLIQNGRMEELNMSLASFNEISRNQLVVSSASVLSLSPYLRTKIERKGFEHSVHGMLGNRSDVDGIFQLDENGIPAYDVSSPPYHPLWLQTSLDEEERKIMFNQYSDKLRAKALDWMLSSKGPVFSKVFPRDGPLYKKNETEKAKPGLLMFYPVFNNAKQIVGSIVAEFEWKRYIHNSIYPPRSDLVNIVVENDCGQAFTFRLQGQDLVLAAFTDVHETRFVDMAYSSPCDEFGGDPSPSDAGGSCRYRFIVYATDEFKAQFITNQSTIYTVVALLISLFTVLVFLTYDILVSRRQNKVLESAKRSSAIVSSLFPKKFRHRLYGEPIEEGSVGIGGGTSSKATSVRGDSSRKTTSVTQPSTKCPSTKSHSSARSSSTLKLLAPSPKTPKSRLKSFLDLAPAEDIDSEPIADFFAAATVLFLDIAGFTAWSSGT